MINQKKKFHILTSAATGFSGSDGSCGTGTAAASEHSAMAIKIKHFHDIVCIFVFVFCEEILVNN